MLIRRIFLVVINVEQTVGLEAGMKRNAHQAVLIVEIRMTVLDVEKLFRVAAIRTFFDDDDFPGLADEEKPARTVRRFAHPDRTVEPQCRKRRAQFNLGQRLGNDGSRR